MAKTEKREKESVGVYEGENLIRTYTLEDNGKDFVKLAESFASKKAGREVR